MWGGGGVVNDKGAQGRQETRSNENFTDHRVKGFQICDVECGSVSLQKSGGGGRAQSHISAHVPHYSTSTPRIQPQIMPIYGIPFCIPLLEGGGGVIGEGQSVFSCKSKKKVFRLFGRRFGETDLVFRVIRHFLFLIRKFICGGHRGGGGGW